MRENYSVHKSTKKHGKAIVFGLYETGLGVIRSLGELGIAVTGIDFKKDIGWYSRYVQPVLCPHPLEDRKRFIEWIDTFFSSEQEKIPAFFTSDDFLKFFSTDCELLNRYFLINQIDSSLFEAISNKFTQYKLALEADIDVPLTLKYSDISEVNTLPDSIRFPALIKGLEVNKWRGKISSKVKGFAVSSPEDLQHNLTEILGKNVPVIVQEILQGPDTNHFKYCSYTTRDGDILAEFTLQKIRQYPIRFGIGAAVESIEKPELVEVGRKLFTHLGYNGIGSAEFKYDERDGKLKLIEINPRYWQQNYLSTACGINFPYIHLQDLLKVPSQPVKTFTPGIKWVNRYLDLDSSLQYRKEGSLSFIDWRRSLKGKKVYSDFTWKDPFPAMYALGFGKKLLRLPRFIWKRVLRLDLD